MRIVLLFSESVMLSVGTNPFFGNHSGSEPKPESHKMIDGRIKGHCTMRLATV
jgi:hypothetical protein